MNFAVLSGVLKKCLQKSLLKKQGIDDQQLAREINKNLQNWLRAESGKTFPAVFYFKELCQVLVISLKPLLKK